MIQRIEDMCTYYGELFLLERPHTRASCVLTLLVTRDQMAFRPCYIPVTLSSIQDVVKLCTVVSKRPSRAMMARDNQLISNLYTRESTHSSLVCTYSSCNQGSDGTSSLLHSCAQRSVRGIKFVKVVEVGDIPWVRNVQVVR